MPKTKPSWPGVTGPLAEYAGGFRAELARMRGAQRTEAIARSAFQGSFGHHNEGQSYPAP